MDEPDDDGRPSSRRALLAGTSLVLGSALAGCTALQDNDDVADLRDRVARLESRVDDLESELADERETTVETASDLAAARAETADRTAEVAALKEDLATCRRRLDTWNLWGIAEDALERLQVQSDQWTDSVVAIDAITPDGLWGVGTGWIYDETVIATNAHVIEPTRLPSGHAITRYLVWTRTGLEAEGELLGYTYGEDDIFDTREDIGFLRVPAAIGRGRVMDRGVSRELAPDEPLLQIGHPSSLEFWTASVGPFLAHREPFFASNVSGQPGVSGSPVIDVDGDVVGMTWGGHYVRAPRRSVGESPRPGDGRVMTSFEEAVNGMHSYMHRIETAYDAIV